MSNEYIASLIQNPWTVAINKANKSGKILANLLKQGYFGRRPITLISFSVGCNVIYHCLKELIRIKNDENEVCEIEIESIIDNVIMLGAPCSADVKEWSNFRKIVGDRIINCYATNDWILRFIFRATSWENLSVAGLQGIKVDGVENINLSNVITGHHEYYDKTPFILKSFIPFVFL